MGLVLGLLGLAGCGSMSGDAGRNPQVGFAFEITDLQTDHQFPGQRNTFHVSYRYRGGLHGAGYDPSGHSVDSDVYPYFQDIRDEMIGYVRGYAQRADFYEDFGQDIAHDVMSKYPQLASLDLSIDVPAYADVPLARTVTVHVTRD